MQHRYRCQLCKWDGLETDIKEYKKLCGKPFPVCPSCGKYKEKIEFQLSCLQPLNSHRVCQMKKHFQFFTTDSDFNSSWFPIDHFFFARQLARGQREGPKVVHLETHASVRNASGMGVSVISLKEDDTQNPNYEEFDDIPTALRRMADIIEAHNKANQPKRKARK